MPVPTDLDISAEQIELLKQSVTEITNFGEEFTAAFYGRFLSSYPEVRLTFANVDMPSQHRKLFRALQLIVGSLANPGELRNYLHTLGQKHENVYVVQSQDFSMFKRALLDTFESFLNEKWTEELHDSWSVAFDAISKMMRE